MKISIPSPSAYGPSKKDPLPRNLGRRLARTWRNPSNKLKGGVGAGTLLAEIRQNLAQLTWRKPGTHRNLVEPGVAAEPSGTRRNLAEEPGRTRRNLAETWRNPAEKK